MGWGWPRAIPEVDRGGPPMADGERDEGRGQRNLGVDRFERRQVVAQITEGEIIVCFTNIYFSCNFFAGLMCQTLSGWHETFVCNMCSIPPKYAHNQRGSTLTNLVNFDNKIN